MARGVGFPEGHGMRTGLPMAGGTQGRTEGFGAEAETTRRVFQGTVSLAHWGIWQIIFGQSEWHSIA